MNAVIRGAGVVTPIGVSALQTAMALRAQKLEPRSTHFRDGRHRPIGCAVAPGVSGLCYGPERLCNLASYALRQLSCSGTPPRIDTPMFLALPEQEQANAAISDDAFIRMLAETSGIALDSRHVSVIRRGPASAAHALADARAHLDAGAPRVIVGGVHSYYHPEVLRRLDEIGALRTEGRREGMLPSEGAAMLMIERASARDDSERIEIAHVATGDEHPFDSQQPNVAATMTRLVAENPRESCWYFTDSAGLWRRQHEWSLVAQRNGIPQKRHIPGPRELGDLGAATGFVLVAVASSWLRVGAAPAPVGVVALLGDVSSRGIVAVTKGGES